MYYSNPVNYKDKSYLEDYLNNKQFAGFMGVSTTCRYYYLSFSSKTKLYKYFRDTGYYTKQYKVLSNDVEAVYIV